MYIISHLRVYVFPLEGNSKIKEGLPDDCLLACTCAMSKLDDVFMKLQAREITILDLRKIEKQQTQMRHLCEAASTQQNEVIKSMFVSYKATIEQRIEEFKCFKEEQGVLLHLCLKIHKIHGMTLFVRTYKYVCIVHDELIYKAKQGHTELPWRRFKLITTGCLGQCSTS